MANKIVFLLVLCVFSAYSAVNFPYPQEKNYGNGTINTTTANASANLKSKFTSFMGSHYEEQGNLARIKFDNTSQTVSEGIGYGMIMMVYFSDATTNYQSQFDKLWAYYQNWTNNNGLMNWRINGFSSIDGSGGATDSELDVAFALEMAYYQFGDQKYLNDAQTLIGKIKQYEMETDGLHKLGDSWGATDRRNPSYVSPAAFELFKRVDNSFWTTAVTRNYTLLKANQNQTTGLVSDWCNGSGNPESNNFGYDASRAPWRWAWSYAWFGHSDAKDLLNKLAAWVSTKSATSINGEINMTNGSMGGCCNNSTFVGPLMNSLQVDSKYQTNINSYWSTLIGLNEDSYFNKSMQILTGLLATGNMPNLKALSEVQPSSSSVTPSSSSTSNDDSSSSEDDGGDDPILVLPKVALLNSAVASKNGINLAVKSNAVVEVFGLKGNSMRKFSFENGVYSVSFSDLPKGLYIVKVSFGSEKKILRVPIK